jgi:hypothetical protein
MKEETRFSTSTKIEIAIEPHAESEFLKVSHVKRRTMRIRDNYVDFATNGLTCIIKLGLEPGTH